MSLWPSPHGGTALCYTALSMPEPEALALLSFENVLANAMSYF